MNKLSTGLLVLLAATNTWAQSQTAASVDSTNVSVTDASSVGASEGFKLPFSLAYRMDMQGPQLTAPSRDFIPGGQMGDQNDPAAQSAIYSRNTVTLGRDLGWGMNLSANLYYNIVHSDPTNNGTTKGLFFNDSYLRLTKGDLASATIGGKDVSLAGDIRYYAPTSRESKVNDCYGQFRFTLAPSIQLSSVFSIESSNYVKVWMNSRDSDPNQGNPIKDLELYASVQANAQLSKAVKAWLLYEADAKKFTDGEWSNGSNPRFSGAALSDIEPGLDISLLNDHLTISPYLNWYPTLPIETTSINLAVTASI